MSTTPASAPVATQQIYLRRQGHSFDLNSNNYPNLGFHIRLFGYQNTYPFYMLEIARHGDIIVPASEHSYNFLENAKRIVEKEVLYKLSISIRIADQIEAYGFDAARVLPHTKDDIFRAAALYDEATDTIRREPDNDCLIAWNPTSGEPIFATEKAVTYEQTAICQWACQQFVKAHNQQPTPQQTKMWLAYLISEQLKNAGAVPVVRESMMRSDRFKQFLSEFDKHGFATVHISEKDLLITCDKWASTRTNVADSSQLGTDVTYYNTQLRDSGLRPLIS